MRDAEGKDNPAETEAAAGRFRVEHVVVMEATIFSPAGVSIVTSVETGPSCMAMTLPSMQLRAEIFILIRSND